MYELKKQHKREFKFNRNAQQSFSTKQIQLQQFQKVTDEKLDEISLWLHDDKYSPEVILLSIASDQHPRTILKLSSIFKKNLLLEPIKYQNLKRKK